MYSDISRAAPFGSGSRESCHCGGRIQRAAALHACTPTPHGSPQDRQIFPYQVRVFEVPRRARKSTDDATDDVLEFAFATEDEHFAYCVCRVQSVFGNSANSAYITDTTRVAVETALLPVSYESDTKDAVLTFLDSHTVSGVASKGSALFDFASDEAAGRRLRVTQAKSMDSNHRYGTNGTNSSAHNSTRARRVESTRGNIKERLRRAGPVDPGTVERWSNCYSGDDVLHQVDMGIVIGKAANNHDNLQLLAFVQSVVHAANFLSMSASCTSGSLWQKLS